MNSYLQRHLLDIMFHMPERTKKILFAVFFIIFSVGMGYALYWMFFRAQTPGIAPETPEQLAAGQLPSAGEGVPGQTTVTSSVPGELPTGEGVAEPVPEGPAATALPSKVQLLRDGVTQAVSPRADGNGARFYNPEDGRFYKVGLDGNVTMLGEKQFFNVDTISWAKQKDEVILEFPDGSNVYYDFAQKKQVTLPQHWKEFEFAPDDNKVVSKSIGIDPNNRFLIVAKPDGSEAKAIEPLGEYEDLAHVSWSPNSQIIAYGETGTPQPENQQEIIFVGQNHESFKSIIVPGRGFTPNWSPTGKQLLFSSHNLNTDNKPTLWITSGDPANLGAGRRTFNLNTWADKCTWADENNIYCGVPQNMPNNAGISRRDFNTLPDDVYHIDLSSGLATKVPLPDTGYTVRSPVVSSDKSKLIFSDAQSGKLYSYDLK